MREIKFRGKHWKTGKWHYGYFWKSPDGLYWIKENGADYRVAPETVGQYVGHSDKNEKEIYESDIVKTDWQHDGSTNYDYEITGEVKWDKDRSQWSIEHEKNGGAETLIYPFYSFEREELLDEGIEVIGNIYENPELIK